MTIMSSENRSYHHSPAVQTYLQQRHAYGLEGTQSWFPFTIMQQRQQSIFRTSFPQRRPRKQMAHCLGVFAQDIVLQALAFFFQHFFSYGNTFTDQQKTGICPSVTGMRLAVSTPKRMVPLLVNFTSLHRLFSFGSPQHRFLQSPYSNLHASALDAFTVARFMHLTAYRTSA